METLHQKVVQVEPDLDSAFCPSCMDLMILMIATLVREWGKSLVPIIVMFPVELSSAQVPPCLPSPHLNQWVRTENTLLVIWYLLQSEVLVET
jgi:hypothetical protein